jgi:hypothetical protein
MNYPEGERRNFWSFLLWLHPTHQERRQAKDPRAVLYGGLLVIKCADYTVSLYDYHATEMLSQQLRQLGFKSRNFRFQGHSFSNWLADYLVFILSALTAIYNICHRPTATTKPFEQA